MAAKKERPARKRGRPTSYTPKLGETICTHIALGGTLKAICAKPSMPDRKTVYNWLFGDHKEGSPQLKFIPLYAQARDAQAETFVDELIEIADTGGSKARLKVDTRKWVISKRLARYADKQVIEGGDPKKPVLTEDVTPKRTGRELCRQLIYELNKNAPEVLAALLEK